MNKVVLIEAKCSVGAEQIGKALAESWNIPFIESNETLVNPCVALNAKSSLDLSGDIPSVKIYLYADPLFRTALYASERNTDEMQAEKIIAEIDASHREVYLAQNHCEIGLTESYDLCVNTAFCNIKKGTKTIRDYVMYRILQECMSEFED